ncbi:4-demethylwyosine synthase TYW1 [Candidatus Pacearchaeota archaeon]|nr:4-demethylwyosine synthase TYW1 [Candidatus Pacearchaeota archaeon]
MIPEKVKKILKKQQYRIVGEKGHSAVQICRWTKNSIRDEGVCYKEKFYGIKSHRCCQMTPAVMWCPNKCLHCWRAIELTLGDKLAEKAKEKLDSPKEIIDGCIKAQKKLLEGFKIKPETKHKTVSKANMKKWLEAQEPMQFAISLSGEPTLYPMIGGLIKELRKRGKTSFLVSNGLYPEKIKELAEKKQLPTQLYISVNTPNKKLYKGFHRSSKKDAWERLNKSLEIISKIKGQNEGRKTRTVFRMNLIKDLNMEDKMILEYANLIKKAKPMFIELKGYMSVGFARQRLGYERMPDYNEMIDFAKKLEKQLQKMKLDYKILDKHEHSRAIVLGKNKKDLKIKSY